MLCALKTRAALAGRLAFFMAFFALAPMAATPAGAQEVGFASFYTAGQQTASGERYDSSKFTAAHRTLRFGSLMRVIYGKRYVVVRINDRGPNVRGRIIDLSLAAAKSLGMARRGLLRVKLEPFLPTPRPSHIPKTVQADAGTQAPLPSGN
jgi:rare lipoprotein A (peptidoglycan hydrolase)